MERFEQGNFILTFMEDQGRGHHLFEHMIFRVFIYAFSFLLKSAFDENWEEYGNPGKLTPKKSK